MGRNSFQGCFEPLWSLAGVLLTFQEWSRPAASRFCRLATGRSDTAAETRLRGGMKSMTDDEVVWCCATAMRRAIAMSRVTSIIAADKLFQVHADTRRAFDEFLGKGELAFAV